MPRLNTIIIIEFSLPLRIGPPELHFHSPNLTVKNLSNGKISTPGTRFAVKCKFTLHFDVGNPLIIISVPVTKYE